MIQSKIIFLEQELNKDPLKNGDILESVRSLNKLLNQIDFNAEFVPVENIKRLHNLFESLKEEALTKQEKAVIKKLSKF
ncbi:hypothetical protein [Bizionia arctica]|uniref:Uncharacterized protein n=1 Tax=Bizionia arctica TaxID=1495645 RepID=A0A917GS39_9FLAO|nr:hypothetical protein [Bizionia arctica]GGG54958.1 hypothetical protein GCM10010976_27360 [Bizionia arctica]